jgi:hypothetical protein
MTGKHREVQDGRRKGQKHEKAERKVTEFEEREGS